MNLQTARSCSRKAALNENLSSEKGKFYVLSRIIREIVTASEVNDTLDVITKNVEDAFLKIGTESFSHEFEIEANKQNLIECFNRYLQFEKKYNGIFVKKNITGDVVIPTRKENISISANLLINRGDVYHLVKFFRGKPSMTYGGRKLDTSPSQSAELYCLQLLGESLKLDKPVVPCFYYLKNKNDKSGLFSIDFEEKKGENIIYRFFNEEEREIIAESLKDVKYDIEVRADCSNCGECTYDGICNVEFIPRILPKQEVIVSKYSRVKVTRDQEKLVMAREGCFSVNAVAGSGKTTVIALRTLSLLEEDESPEKVLMITFTDKARREMYNKINGYEQVFYKGWGFDTKKINIETFNSWGQKLISANFDKLGYSSSPTIIEDITKRDIVVSILEKSAKLPINYEFPFMDLPYVKGAVIEIAKIIDQLKAENVKTTTDVETILPDTIKVDNKWFGMQQLILNVYNSYNEELKNRNVIDYEDQLRLLGDLKPYGVFEKLPYEHIIVDEFQDSNKNQISIIEDLLALNNGIKSLVVVGDIMQSIYGFRNTTPDNLLNFGKIFSNVTSIDLADNFRSDKGIIEWANRIILKESKLPKFMNAYRKKVYEPVLEIYEKDDEAEEIIVSQVTEWVSRGVPLSDITILARTKNELIKYQQILGEQGFDTVLKVPEIVKDNPYVQSVFALRNYLSNHDDIKSLAFYAKSLNIDPFDKFKVLQLGEELKVNILAQLSEEEKINAFFVKLEETAGKDYIAKNFIEKLDGINAHTLNEILTYIKKYDVYEVKDSYTVETTDSKAITLITVHSSKGLEYPNVILPLGKFKDSEEENRLLYVGVTRAKDELLILASKKQHRLIDLLTA